MKNSPSRISSRALDRSLYLHREYLLRQGILKLLAVKDSDVRILTVEQSRDAIDKGLHAGGAFSATIPLVALFYGGFLNLNIQDPTQRGQDIFTLSKGHAVATLASIYMELGYFDQGILRRSRSYESILNGHPGPLLPGIHIATGPMGQGIGVAQGFAVAGKVNPHFDSYCLTGDGELQEGAVWEAVMYAGQHHLDNFCVLVDRNNGQLDIHNRMIFPMPKLDDVFRSFGWEACDVDATQYDGVFAALERFKYGPRNGKPTAIICNATKGYGAFSDFMNKHKVTVPESLIVQEIELQNGQRHRRIHEIVRFLDELDSSPEGRAVRELLLDTASDMHLSIEGGTEGKWEVTTVAGPVALRRVPRRDKSIRYHERALPKLDPKKHYTAAEIVTSAMKVFARDPRVVSIDSDLASTSGLEAGVAAVDQQRAMNAGVAEANMMLIGEAFAALGANTWVSTFCPFFNWQVLRRTAVGHQERLEAIEAEDGWLSEGHGLDLTYLATAANFETRTNGATHMGNDDIMTFDAVAHLKIIDVSCPQQLLSIMKWIMEGNRGLIYLRVMRTESAVLYDGNYAFAFNKGYKLRSSEKDQALIISSGRGVHEALAAAEICKNRGLNVGVVDMPSVDAELLLELYASRKLLIFAEQNNGYLWQNFLKVLYAAKTKLDGLESVLTINTLNADGKPQFIHSATYEELIAAFGLTPSAIADSIETSLAGRR